MNKSIINTYDQLKAAVEAGTITKQQAVCISYYRRPGGRSVETNKSKVYSPFFQTNPASHWSDYGCKAFVGKRAESLPEALRWATETYKIEKWARNRMGDMVPEIVQKTHPIPKRENEEKD